MKSMGFASVFTGWNYYQTNQANGRLPSNWYPARELHQPDGAGADASRTGHQTGARQCDAAAGVGQSDDLHLRPTTLIARRIWSRRLDSIFNNQNVGPFICRELIQRLVTSNPSRDYVYRVAQVFNDDGTGVRGNMQAVVQAILLDYEARSPDMIPQPTYGKQREPLVRVTALARAFPAPPPVSGTYSQTSNQMITITTASPHLLNNGDTACLTFTDTSGNAAPPNRRVTA